MSTTNWPRTDAEITFSGAFTCTHHNDAERTACPVCLVATLTAERDHWQGIAQTMSAEREHNANVAQEMTAERDQLRTCGELSCDECNARTAALTAERDELRDRLAAAQHRGATAIASWDEERYRALREGKRVVEWRDRAERAEAELATERAHRNELSTLVKRLVREARRARPSDPLSYLAVDYLVRNKLHGEPMRPAMKEDAK